MGDLDVDRKELAKAVDGALQEIGQGAGERSVATPGGAISGSLGRRGKGHGPGAVDVLCRVSGSVGSIRCLAGRMPDGLDEPERA